jgi:hypothetical protein
LVLRHALKTLFAMPLRPPTSRVFSKDLCLIPGNCRLATINSQLTTGSWQPPSTGNYLTMRFLFSSIRS